MKKHIRPIAAFKKQHPWIYQLFASDRGSKKGQENSFYFTYAFAIMSEELDDPFFHDENFSQKNKSTVTELGRLLLTAWYYSDQPWAKRVGGYIRKAWEKKREINDLEFAEGLKQIRANIEYYYHNDNQLKLFILQKFFTDELEKLLPDKPKKLLLHQKIIDESLSKKRQNLRGDKDYYYKRALFLEDYITYLQKKLVNEDYLTLDEYEKDRERFLDNYFEGIIKETKRYEDSIIDNLPKLLERS